MHGAVSTLEVKNENALVLSARSGDDCALRALLLKYEPFIGACSGLYHCAGAEPDDLMQEGRLGLVTAVRRYRSEAGVPFGAFARLCVKRQILSAVRRALSGKNKPMNGYIPLDDVDKKEVSCSESANPETIFIQRERISAVRAQLNQMFSPFERRVFTLYLSGFSYHAIAESLHVGSKKIDNSLQRIKRRLSYLFES